MNKLIPGLLLIINSTVYAQPTTLSCCETNTSYASISIESPRIIETGYLQTVPDQDNDDAVKIKTISKTFPADRSDKVFLNNKFGTTIIKTWERREVKLDVSVRAYSNNEKQAQELVDQVNIDMSKIGEVISCKTDISRDNRHSRNRKNEVKVNYIVYMPASISLNLSQQFGNVNIGDLSGSLNAKVQYGDFVASSLMSDNNLISVQYGKTNIGETRKATVRQQYGSGLIIGTAQSLDLDAQYANVNINTIKGDAVIRQQYGSGLKIGSVNNIDLDVQYASVNINTVKGNATVNQQYNSLAIGAVGRINLRSQYAGVTIGMLKNDGTFKVSYNNLNIGEVGSACKVLNVNAEYVDVNLGFADDYQADFTVHRTYGAFKYGNRVRAYVEGDAEQQRNSSSKTYTGKIGNGGVSHILVKASYGNVSFR